MRENLDMGRPDHVQLIFDRRVSRRTPTRHRTRVITDGVIPSLHVDYKHSRIKQYHKEGRTTETSATTGSTARATGTSTDRTRECPPGPRRRPVRATDRFWRLDCLLTVARRTEAMLQEVTNGPH